MNLLKGSSYYKQRGFVFLHRWFGITVGVNRSSKTLQIHSSKLRKGMEIHVKHEVWDGGW